MRLLASLLLAPVLFLASMLHAEDPLVFISAFAPGDKAAIHAFRFDATSGALAPLQRTVDLQNPFFLAISPDHHFLYAINAKEFAGADNEFVAAYAIEGRTGALRRLNEQSSRGTAFCYLDVDATGRTVVVANYSSGSVAALPVAADGRLGEAASFMQHTGSSVDPQRQKGPNAHSIVISPDNRFALAADLGIDKIMIYRLDPSTAKLTPGEAQPFAALPPGSGPRHQAFHPNGRHLYVINEMKNTVAVFDYTAESGRVDARQTISTLPETFSGKSYTADVKITPDGKFLYGTNRGHDSIAIFRIAPEGTLTLISLEPSLGKGPQNLLITPDGNWLLCANMPGNSVVVFKIDHQTGALKATGTPTSMPMPSCIRWLP
jgi:6-phosphogluconolactonase